MNDIQHRHLKIAYITSMKKGLPSFVAREVNEINKTDNQIFIYSTKYSSGLYMPANQVYRMKPISIIVQQIFYLFYFSKKYLRLFIQAISTNSLIDFFIGCDFAFNMKKVGIHTIHCVEGLRSLNIGYYCGQLLNLPLTVTIYADGLYIAPNEKLLKRALNECEKIITICDFNRQILIQKFDIPEDKIALIPVILDSEVIKPEKTFNILIVAQFAERKGHKILFEAVRQLNRNDIKVWVVGNRGTDKTFVDVPGLAKDMGIEKSIIFWGNVPEPALFHLYQACDVFCLPSVDAEVPEGTPVALMEAMAFEKPVISTRHAGIPEYVEHILIEQNNVADLKKALLFFIENPAEKVKQGRENRKIIQEKFPVSKIDELIAVFQEITGG